MLRKINVIIFYDINYTNIDLSVIYSCRYLTIANSQQCQNVLTVGRNVHFSLF